MDRTNAFSPFCAARMKFFMRGAGNAEICLRRQEYFYGLSEAVYVLYFMLSLSFFISLRNRNKLTTYFYLHTDPLI